MYSGRALAPVLYWRCYATLWQSCTADCQFHMAADLTERQRRILARLVAEYIEQGEPVSSAWLAEHSALGLSSATVRNILARLEEQGLVHQPHTSAGRVPTDSGYRLYVDRLLGRAQAAAVAARRRGPPAPRPGTVGDLLENASQELSRASHQIAFALGPAQPDHAPAAHRFREPRRPARARDRRLHGRPDHAQGHRHRGALRRAMLRRRPTTSTREFAGLTLHEARIGDRRAPAPGAHAVRRACRRARSAGAHRPGRRRAARTRCTSRARRSWSTNWLGDTADRDRTLETLRALLRHDRGEAPAGGAADASTSKPTASRSSSGPSTSSPDLHAVQPRRVQFP